MIAEPQNLFLYAAALAFVLALVALFGWLARRFLPGAGGGATGKRKRLALLEALTLDPKTRAILLRRDDVEHLIVLGPHGAVKVESLKAGPEDRA